MSEQEKNIAISGDEARLLISAMMQCKTAAQVQTTLELFMRLNELNMNQPPTPPKAEQ